MLLSLASACGRSVVTDTVLPADGPVRGVGFAPRGGILVRETRSIGRTDENLLSGARWESRREGAGPVLAARPNSSANFRVPDLAGGGVVVAAGVGVALAAGGSPTDKRGEWENRRILIEEQEEEEEEDEQQEEK